MASPGYMWIKDENGALINSDVRVSGREKSVLVLGLKHEVHIPTDVDTGALTGVRKHEPFVVLKQFCPATPVLNKACASGKTLQQVTIDWYHIDKQGHEKNYYTQILSDVKVVSVKPHIGNVKLLVNEGLGHLEEVAFRYAKIEWLYREGNLSTQDEWINRS